LFSDIELNQSFLLVGFKEILEIVLFSHLFVCLVLIYGSKEAIKKKETKESDLNKNIPLDDSLAINMSIVNAAILKKSKKNLKEKELIIKGLNKNETIAMNSNQLLYVKSEGHYVRVYYFEKYKNKKIIKHSLIRNSIKNMEVIVENVSTIIRTHKSYIVNLEHINYVRCNMRKGLVSINKADVKLPIGKTYIDFLVNHINSMHPEVKLFH
jgi:DNA-binding LytR/AlgR family response regulator